MNVVVDTVDIPLEESVDIIIEESEDELSIIYDDERSDSSSVDYPPSVYVDELNEPIPPDDRLVIVGYYCLGSYYGTFRNTWGRKLPLAMVGRTVFCGHLESDATQKIEVELCLQKSEFEFLTAPTATAVMRRVVDYGKDMLCVVKQTAVIEPLSTKRVENYSCPYFTVDDEAWYRGERAPFTVTDALFEYA